MTAAMAGAAPQQHSRHRQTGKTALAAVGNQSGIDTWRVAVVLGLRPDKSVEIGLDDGARGQIPFT